MKSGGEGAGRIQGVQLGMGNGASFAGDRDASWRGSFMGGVTLSAAGDPFQGEDIGHKLVAVPLNLNIERVANGLWSYGADAGVRLDLFVMNIDAGLRMSLLSGDGENGLGVTPFVRMGFAGDYVGIEGGALAYSGHGDVDAGRGYVMAYLNPGAIIGYFARAANLVSRHNNDFNDFEGRNRW